jgi:dihydroneopterin aldolase
MSLPSGSPASPSEGSSTPQPPTRPTTRPVILGILNVTPDSFSDGGRWQSPSAAIDHALELVEQGADIIDIGGESTRPGAARVPAVDELARILPIVRELSRHDIHLSIDTMNASTAGACVDAGARYINDVSGGLADSDMYRVAASSGAKYIAMHWREHSETMQRAPVYADVVGEVRGELSARHHRSGAGVLENRRAQLAVAGRSARVGEPGVSGARGGVAQKIPGRIHRPGSARERSRQRHGDAQRAVGAGRSVGSAGAQRGRDPRRARRVESLDVRTHSTSRNGPSMTNAPHPLDRIILTGLRATAFHGVFEHEKRDGQDFFIDLTVHLDFSAAAAGDELAETVHYGILAEEVVAAVESDPVDLIETVAERVATVALAHTAVQLVEVTIHKPGAPITVPFADVAVSITRGRA